MCTKMVASEGLWGSQVQKPIHLIFLPQIFANYLVGNMPKVKRSRKAPPDGWELIEPTLDELDQKMREGEWGSLRLGEVCLRVTGLDDPPGARHKCKYRWEETGSATMAS